MVEPLVERVRIWIAYVGVKESKDKQENIKKATTEVIESLKSSNELSADKQFVSSLHLKKDGMFLAYASKTNEAALDHLQEKKISWGTYHSMEEYKARVVTHKAIPDSGEEPE